MAKAQKGDISESYADLTACPSFMLMIVYMKYSQREAREKLLGISLLLPNLLMYVYDLP